MYNKKTVIFSAKEWVTMQDFIDSHDKITIGTDWKSRQKDKEDLKVSVFSNVNKSPWCQKMKVSKT